MLGSARAGLASRLELPARFGAGVGRNGTRPGTVTALGRPGPWGLGGSREVFGATVDGQRPHPRIQPSRREGQKGGTKSARYPFKAKPELRFSQPHGDAQD